MLANPFTVDVDVDVDVSDPRIAALPLAELDPADPQYFVDDTIGQVLARLRAEAPVHRSFSPVPSVGHYWSVTRFEDIQFMEANPALFSSDGARGGITLSDPFPGEQQLPMFIAMDPPRHEEQRKAVAPVLASANLVHWQALIRERTCAVLDGLPRGTPFDWVARVSAELTNCMLATLFDMPLEDRHLLSHWSFMATAHKESNPDAPEPAVRMGELQKMLGYFLRLWNERVNAPPRSDLVSMLAHNPATRGMSPIEFMGNLVLLIVGGSDTTRNAMTGGLLALVQHPQELAKLRANPALVKSLVPEIVRWQTPLAYMRRTAVVDTVLGGQPIQAGDKLAMWFLSGNRDASAIEDADRFIVDRARPRQHLAFGSGIHHCMGSRLADLQLSVLWEEVLRRFPVIEVVGAPVRVRSAFVRGFSELQVRLPA